MQRALVILTGAVLLVGCVSYKELLPDPLVNPEEKGFIGVYDGEKMFILYEGKHHFINFPAPPSDKFYLVLITPPKSVVPSSLVRDFNGGVGSFETIPDETPENDTLSVYPIDLWASGYAWVTGEIKTEFPLMLRYRYVPQWRFTFENRHAAYSDSLLKSRADRSTYESIRPGFDFESIDVRQERTLLVADRARAAALEQELTGLEKLLPDDISGSRDTAYLVYLSLREDLAEEIGFHDAYLALLNVLLQERDSRGKTEEFIGNAGLFTAFLTQERRHPERVRESVRQLLLPRISTATDFVEKTLREKTDLEPFPSTEPLAELSEACNAGESTRLPSLTAFIRRFNEEILALSRFEREAEQIEQEFPFTQAPPSDSLYASLVRHSKSAAALIPESQVSQQQKFKSLACAKLLGTAIGRARARSLSMQTLYEQAEQIALALQRSQWNKAESALSTLQERRADWSPFPALALQRDTIVHRGERDVFFGVTVQSRARAESFIRKHATETDGIPALYQDSVFLPVHFLRFSALGSDETVRKRGSINRQMERLRTITFPEDAIKNLYRELQNDHSGGVKIAQTIVEHGRRYQGDDSQVKGLVNEFDASVAKTLSRARQYRRVYALPVRRSTGGHEYAVKLRLVIPSDAQFPVFDVHIKLPEEVAAGAGRERWYKSITINNKPIKNEGRFRITSPLRENNFESLISPVQTDKKGNNILKVRFVHPDSRLFEISAMAQVPIIRKN